MGWWDNTKEFGAYLADSAADLVGVKTTLAADQFTKDNTLPSGAIAGVQNTPSAIADYKGGVTTAEATTLAEQHKQVGSIIDKAAGLLGIGAGLLIGGLAIGAVIVGYLYIGAPKRR